MFFVQCKRRSRSASVKETKIKKIFGDFSMQTLHQKYITAKSVIEFSLTIQMLTHAGNAGVHDTRQAIQLAEQNKHVQALSMQMLKDS